MIFICISCWVKESHCISIVGKNVGLWQAELLHRAKRQGPGTCSPLQCFLVPWPEPIEGKKDKKQLSKLQKYTILNKGSLVPPVRTTSLFSSYRPSSFRPSPSLYPSPPLLFSFSLSLSFSFYFYPLLHFCLNPCLFLSSPRSSSLSLSFCKPSMF